ncbi:MAG: site-2 protease family protein [Terracidiphilus sp.]
MSSSAFVIAVFEFVLLLFSISVHECAHAWMASRLGDQTARMVGRVSLNPMDHIDPIGTLLFPAIVIFGPLFGFSMFSGLLIGWAKPTPVNTRNFSKIVRDDNLVTLAGPASNLLLVIVAFLMLAVLTVVLPNGHSVVMSSFFASLHAIPGFTPQPVVVLCTLAILINLSLCVFNLLPIPPLDGSHLLRNLLPYGAVRAYDRIPIWVSYALMILVGGAVIMAFVSPAIHLVIWGLVHV